MEKIKELPEKSEEMVTISRAEYEALQAKLSAKCICRPKSAA